jgi:formylglycine-generating enzyme required for sulfatase activity
LEIAFNDGDSIIAIRLEDHEIPTDLQYFLSTGQWIDAFERDLPLELAGIVKSIRTAVAGAPIPPSIRRARRRRIVTYAAPILAVILAAVIWSLSGPQTKGTEPPSSSSENKAAQLPTPETNAGAAPSTETINAKDDQKYVLIPAGRYFMGCSGADSECEEDEKPAHWVSIAKPFWLGQSEVTVRAFQNYAKTIGREVSVTDGRLPITEVNRAEAAAYCKWAGGRLPSEAEWEYAARGGQPEPRYGPVLDIAWIETNSGEAAHPVGQKQPNAYGLQDMLGNVSEWVLDRYYNKYDEEEANSATEEPVAGNATAVVRGGSWAFGPSSARASNRTEMEKESMEPVVGFRCLLETK